MVSYRESDQCSEQVDHVEQLTDANQQLTTTVTVRDNRKLKSDVRAKVIIVYRINYQIIHWRTVVIILLTSRSEIISSMLCR